MDDYKDNFVFSFRQEIIFLYILFYKKQKKYIIVLRI